MTKPIYLSLLLCAALGCKQDKPPGKWDPPATVSRLPRCMDGEMLIDSLFDDTYVCKDNHFEYNFGATLATGHRKVLEHGEIK